MESMRLSYTLAPDELADAMILHGPSLRSNMRTIRLFWGVMAGCFLTLAFVSYRGMLVPFAMTLIAAATPRFQVRRAALRMVRTTPALTEPTSVTFESDGLQIDTEMSRLWYAWRNYESVVSTPAGVGLVGRGVAVLRWIPARAFASEDDREAWVTTARNAMTPP